MGELLACRYFRGLSIQILKYRNSDVVQFHEICQWHFMMESRALKNGAVSKRRAAGCKVAHREGRGYKLCLLFLCLVYSLVPRGLQFRHPHAARSSRHSPTTPFTSLKTKLITTAHSLSFNYPFFKISTQLRLNSCRKKDDSYTLGWKINSFWKGRNMNFTIWRLATQTKMLDFKHTAFGQYVECCM